MTTTVLPFDKRMKKDVTQKQREMLGRPLAIADAECYTGIVREREREAALLIVPVWESMED